ncbi:MAG: hypothetical protein HC763_12475, partial [Hydrococcus sp. CRU_1_1]|nr:hypothetical protein [Hydrococcus sp. CRU_1_1]
MQFQNGRVDRGIHRKGDIAIAPAGLSNGNGKEKIAILVLALQLAL